MTNEEHALLYQRQHPPHINHQEAGEDLLALIAAVRTECAVAASSACYSQRPVYEACMNSGVDDGK